MTMKKSIFIFSKACFLKTNNFSLAPENENKLNILVVV